MSYCKESYLLKSVKIYNDFNCRILFLQVEVVQMKVFEFKPELEAQGLEPEANFKKNYLKLTFTRLMVGESNISPFDLADQQSQELLDAVLPLKGKTGEKVASLLEVYPEGFSKLMYLDSARIYGDFSEKSLPAALSQAFKILAKGTPDQEWIAVAYQDNTFLNKSKLVSKNVVEDMVNQAGFLQLNEKFSGMSRSDNTLLMASAYTLNMNYDCDETLVNKSANQNQKKLKP
jgi:hypothetical protein